VDNPRMSAETPYPALRWEIFCRVIDNFGDIGVCWRLACNLARRGQVVRLWVDDPSALRWMAPEGCVGVEVRPWASPFDVANTTLGDVLVEAFGCEIDPEFIAAYTDSIRDRDKKGIWINLEYLSAEGFAKACHGLPSPVMRGPGAGLTKHFFYPGFTFGTGGLLREPDLLACQGQFDRRTWLAQHGVRNTDQRVLSLFCYEPTGLGELLNTLAADAQPTCLLVTPGRASAAVHAEIARKIALQPLWNKRQALSIVFLPALSQTDFDRLLWSCDLNFVRGEDSLVRAIWAGQAFVWQIYPQDDDAHLAKLNAFLDWLAAPDSLRQVHAQWNRDQLSAQAERPANPQSPVTPPRDATKSQLDLSATTLRAWRDCVQAARAKTMTQADLATQLLGFVAKKH
jgi:uncharacterized repeat protein (TIGR03837 family)